MINNKLNKYTILDHCIACTTCSTVSPNVFKIDTKKEIACIINQPQHINDEQKTFSALKSCPVSAISKK